MFGALVGAAAASAAFPVAAKSPAPVRIALLPIESAAEVFYARDLGLFERAGIAVDLQQLQNGEAIAAAVAASAADIGYATVPPLAVAHSRGIPFKIVAAAALAVDSAPFALLAVRPDSPIRSARDTNGKTLGIIGLGTIADYVTRAWIDGNGGDSTTVKFVEIPAPALPAALAAGRIDVALLVEPYLTQGRELHDRILGNPLDSVAKEFATSVWFSTPQWVGAHPDLASRFAAIVYEAAKWSARNPARSAAVLAQVTKMDPAVLAKMTRVPYADRLTPAMIQPVVDVTAKYGKFPTFSAQELLYRPQR